MAAVIFIRGLSTTLRVNRNDFPYSTGRCKPSKIVNTMTEALAGLKDRDMVLLGGFSNCGVPEHLTRGIIKQGINNLSVVAISAGEVDYGNGKLITEKLVRRIITAYAAEHQHVSEQFYAGTLEIELCPMGNLVERVRAGGAGIPAFYTASGVGTMVEEGGMPIRCSTEPNSKKVVEVSAPVPKRMINGREYLLQTAITGDFALAKAWKADPSGNLVFRKMARNINTSVLMAARVGVVEVEEIVPLGSLDPNFIHLPGIYVDRILLGDNFTKKIQHFTIRDTSSKLDPRENPRQRIAQRVAMEFRNGMYVNLGIGIPSLAVEFIPEDIEVTLQGDNGILGLGPHPTEEEVDADMINPSAHLVTCVPGAAFSDSQESFAMIRGGHLDLTVLGSLQVSQFGDIANWSVPGKLIKGMGGAMDLVSSRRTKVVVAMEHTSKDGLPKILPDCNLPLTGKRVVNRIITDKCVFDVNHEDGLTLLELAEGETVESIKLATGCEFKVTDDLKPMLTRK